MNHKQQCCAHTHRSYWPPAHIKTSSKHQFCTVSTLDWNLSVSFKGQWSPRPVEVSFHERWFQGCFQDLVCFQDIVCNIIVFHPTLLFFLHNDSQKQKLKSSPIICVRLELMRFMNANGCMCRKQET